MYSMRAVRTLRPQPHVSALRITAGERTARTIASVATRATSNATASSNGENVAPTPHELQAQIVSS